MADPEFKILLREVIQSFTFNGKSQGIPIGNLTSQIFTNILLDRLDSYVKHELGVKHYFRYADDCLMINENRAQLEKFFKSMKIFLENELLLQFHPNKIFIKPYHQGVDFLGIILRPHYRTLRTKTLRRIDKRLDARLLEYEQEKISIELLKSTKNSYYSLLAHINGYQKQQELLNKYMVLG